MHDPPRLAEETEEDVSPGRPEEGQGPLAQRNRSLEHVRPTVPATSSSLIVQSCTVPASHLWNREPVPSAENRQRCDERRHSKDQKNEAGYYVERVLPPRHQQDNSQKEHRHPETHYH